MEQRAVAYGELHDAGYRFTWPPVIKDLTPRQVKLLRLRGIVEADLERQANQQTQAGGSVSHDNYDVGSSRREWEQQFQ